jgi:Raf kinase inhibitor-like YbhB/YbcL family protein
MPNPLGRALRNRRAGHHTLAWAHPGLDAPETITLSSAAFEHRAAFPERYKGRVVGTNISPALSWTEPPAGTAELVLLVQDPDAPRATPAIHALVVGVAPDSRGIREGALAHPSPIEGLRHGNGPLGRRGWVGPMPVPSHGPHSYVFQLFALDRRLDLPERFGVDDVLALMAGHVIARARLDGMYEIP